MVVNKYKDKVYEILNFLTDEEYEKFLYIIKNSKEEDWPKIINNEFVKNDTFWSSRLLFINREDTKAEAIDKRIESLFKNITNINQVSAIQRYLSNKGMQTHTDNEWDSSVRFGIVIYLNDDFTGGEIHYPNLNLTIKPKVKSLIIHPAGELHGVNPIGPNDKRYIISVFARGEKNATININMEEQYGK